MTKLMIAFTVF